MTIERTSLSMKRLPDDLFMSNVKNNDGTYNEPRRVSTDKPYDIYLEEDGNLAMVKNAEAVGQHARQRLMTFYNEWFLDKEAGVIWLSEVLGQRYNSVAAEAVTKAELLETDGIESVETFSVRFDRNIRQLESFGIFVKTDYDNEGVQINV